jgi:hypothetical protein
MSAAKRNAIDEGSIDLVTKMVMGEALVTLAAEIKADVKYVEDALNLFQETMRIVNHEFPTNHSDGIDILFNVQAHLTVYPYFQKHAADITHLPVFIRSMNACWLGLRDAFQLDIKDGYDWPFRAMVLLLDDDEKWKQLGIRQVLSTFEAFTIFQEEPLYAYEELVLLAESRMDYDSDSDGDDSTAEHYKLRILVDISRRRIKKYNKDKSRKRKRDNTTTNSDPQQHAPASPPGENRAAPPRIAQMPSPSRMHRSPSAGRASDPFALAPAAGSQSPRSPHMVPSPSRMHRSPSAGRASNPFALAPAAGSQSPRSPHMPSPSRMHRSPSNGRSPTVSNPFGAPPHLLASADPAPAPAPATQLAPSAGPAPPRPRRQRQLQRVEVEKWDNDPHWKRPDAVVGRFFPSCGTVSDMINASQTTKTVAEIIKDNVIESYDDGVQGLQVKKAGHLGYGLYAKRSFEKGCFIQEYRGFKISAEEASREEAAGNVFVMHIYDAEGNVAYAINACNNKYGSVAKFVNTGTQKTNNAEYVQERLPGEAYSRSFLVATRSIPAKAQILASYGANTANILAKPAVQCSGDATGLAGGAPVRQRRR